MSTLGKYRLIRKLATGGMAQVYLAKAAGAMGFEKNVVLKRILPHLAEIPSFVEMFLAEAKLAARLDHPNIVQIFDFGEVNGNFFLAMEYLDGPNLRVLVSAARRQGRQLPLAACAKIISFACEGLAYAHEIKNSETGEYLNLIHRDISPDNIMLSRNGSVKIVDFGIAKAADSTHQTRTGMLKGKLAYMPPEQLRAESLDRRADIFALGMVLYGLIAGNRPFEATSEVGMMQAILNEPLIPIAKRRAEVPLSLQAIMDKALAKSREDRYPDCRAFQADLERFVVEMGEPVGAWQLAQLIEELVPTAPIDTSPVPTPSPASQEAELGAVEIDLETKMAPTPPLPPVQPGPGALSAVGGEETFNTLLDPTVPGSPPTDLGAPSTDTAPSSIEPAAPPSKRPQKGESSRALALGILGALVFAGIVAAWIVVPRIGQQDQTEVGARVETDSESVEEVASAAGTTNEAASPGVDAATEEPGPDPVAQTQPEDAAEPESQPKIEEPEPPRAVAARPEQRRPAAQAPRKGVTNAGAAARPAAAAAPQRASLTIDSNAPVQVRIGGHILGRTPVRVEDIAPGEVEVELFDRSLGISKRQRITVREGEQVSRTIEIGTGTLEFRVRPYASVFLNGRPLGQTPLAPVEVYEGRHVITLVNRELDREVRVEHQVQPGANVFRYNLAE